MTDAEGRRTAELGRLLKGAREKANRERRRSRQPLLTQATASKHLGFDQSHLSRIEAGKVDLSFLEVERLANFYGVRFLDELRTIDSEERREQHHKNFLCK